MKNLLFGLMMIALLSVIVGFLGYFGIGDLSVIERQTFSILVNVKIVIAFVAYIAWRVTPPSKP